MAAYADAFLAFKARLLELPEFSEPARVRVTLVRKPFPAAGGPQCLIIPSKQKVDGAGGRQATTSQARVVVIVLDRCALDDAQSDEIALAAQDVALLRLVERVADALHLGLFDDAGGEPLFMEPVRLVDIDDPESYGKDAPEWRGIPLIFEASYFLDLPGQVCTTDKFEYTPPPGL